MKQLLKIILALLPILICTEIFGQTNPAKLRYSQGFFSTNYELGEKDVSKQKVSLHLEKHSSDAYYNFKRGLALETQSNISGIVGASGFLIGLLAKKPGWQITGYSVAVLGFSIELGTLFVSNKKKEKGINIYNEKFGYR